MEAAPPVSRPRWDDVPEDVRDAVESQQGAPVEGADYPSGGFTPGIAARLTFADGAQVFVKGIALTNPTAGHYEAEAEVGPYVPSAVAPALLWSVRTAGWLLNGYEDLPGATPDLSPGSADLAPALSAVGLLWEQLTPCPAPEARPVSVILAELPGGWSAVADEGMTVLDPWAVRNLDRLVAGDDGDLLVRASTGSTLLHCDLRADNLLTDGTGVRVIDWAWAARGAAWVDPAFFAPQLILAGHTPAEAEAQLTALVPAWRTAAPEALTAFAVAITGYWRRHQVSGPGGALGVYRGLAAEAGQRWIAYRTGWE